MGCYEKDKNEIPYLIVSNELIVEVSKKFCELTDYPEEFFIGISLYELCSILKINSSSKLKDIDNDNNHYLFTKSYEPREVIISCQELDYLSKRIYYFKEKENSRIENKFMVIDKLLLDNQVGIGIYSSPDLILLKANQIYLNLLDEPYNKLEISVGMNINNFIDWNKINGGQEIWRNIINTGNTYYGKEVKGITGLWKNNYCDNTIVPITEDGKVKYVVSIVEDVTEKVLARQRNEEQAKIIELKNKQLEAIFENISEGVFVADKDERFILQNKEAKNFVNNPEEIDYLIDEFNCTTFTDLEGNIIPYEEMPLQRSLRGEVVKNFKEVIKLPNKELIVECNSSPIYDNNGDISMALVCNHDITELVNSKRIVEQQVEMLNQIIQCLDLPFIRLSYPDLTVLDINQNGYKILKAVKPHLKSKSDIIGENYKSIILDTENDEAFNYVQRVGKEKKTSHIKNRKWIISGEEMFVNTLYQPIYAINGEVEEIIGIVFDVTSEIKANKNMEKTLKLQEEFFANISHELKTPLNVIYVTVQLLNMYLKNGLLGERKDSTIRYINSITQNCHRLSKLINNIVDLSKIESGYFELNLSNNNIVEVVEEIVMSVTDYIDSKGLNIIFDTEIEEKIIACDIEKIERIILNLISNAIKFSDAGNQIYVDIQDKDEFVEISVKDNGIGIESSHLDMIFDRFKQVDKSLSRNAEGTGIGLSLVKAIVELHGGRIFAESEFGKGSKFTVLLPCKIAGAKGVIHSSKARNSVDNIKVELSDIS